MDNASVKTIPVIKVSFHGETEIDDVLAVEEPLEIRLSYLKNNQRVVKNVSVTMRTPCKDAELAAGFLLTEGIIKSQNEIDPIETSLFSCFENKENIILINLRPGILPDLHNAERNFYTTSSCGVCGKGSINAIRTVSSYSGLHGKDFFIGSDMLCGLPAILSQNQQVFANTGGIHASALFNKQGELLIVREDVGRHNALDKLIGAAMQQNWLPLNEHILLLSGRASFELVQKAAMAGISIIAAIGAPSSLAVEVAQEFNITLTGFLKSNRFNIYTAAHRILLPANEITH